MKKFNKVVLFFTVIVATFFLTACGEEGAGGGTTHLNFATGGVAGTYYPLGGAMAGVINANTDLSLTVMATGASADNINQLARGDAHIAIAQNDVMYYAFTGTGIWEIAGNEPVTNLATLMTLYPETIQIVVPYDSGIYSVTDLAGQRVSIGDIGSGVEANALQILAAYGMSTDDIVHVSLGFGASADAMRDNNLDAFFVTAATPNTAVNELAIARDLRLVPLSDEAIAHLLNTYAFYVPVTVTSDDGYAWLTEPIQTVAVQATLVTTLDMSDDVAYAIVSTLINMQASVAEGHARGHDISAENAVQSLSVELHPGARRFFEGLGVLD